jgi:hypothetical protein
MISPIVDVLFGAVVITLFYVVAVYMYVPEARSYIDFYIVCGKLILFKMIIWVRYQWAKCHHKLRQRQPNQPRKFGTITPALA